VELAFADFGYAGEAGSDGIQEGRSVEVIKLLGGPQGLDLGVCESDWICQGVLPWYKGGTLVLRSETTSAAAFPLRRSFYVRASSAFRLR
jgi:hypothetical protein